MDSVIRVGRISVNMALLERVRQVVMCIAIALLVIYIKPFPVAMAVGSLLGIVYVALAWRQIRWRDWWPLLALEVFYLIEVLNLRGPLDPSLVDNPNWAEMQLCFVLVPFMFIGLEPKKSWGTVWVWSNVAILTLALLVATYFSFQTVDGEVRFISYPLEYYEHLSGSSWKALREGFSYFSYSSLARNVRAWPMFLSYSCVVSILIVLHRLFRGRDRAWVRILLCVYFAVGVFLCNTRAMYPCLVLLAGLVFCRMLLKKSYRPMPMYVVLLAVAGVMGLFIIGSRGREGIVRSAGGPAQFFSSQFNHLVQTDARMNLWKRTLQERDAFLPWGVGSGECGTFIKDHYYYKYGDVYGDTYKEVDKKELPIKKMHNVLFDAVVEFGYPGLLYMLFLLIVPLTRVRRMKFIHVLLYVSLLVLCMFESIVYLELASFCFCMVYCAVIAYSVGESPEGTTAALDVDGKAAT